MYSWCNCSISLSSYKSVLKRNDFSTVFVKKASIQQSKAMKKIHCQIFTISILIFLSSCGTYKTFTGNIQYDASKQNDVTKSGELYSYLESKEQVRFVLRSPKGYESFSEEEQIKWNNLFAHVEKELIVKGHIVKDRVLLELLLEKGDMSVIDVGKAIDTDIIIEIVDVEFDIPNQVREFSIKEKGISTNFNIWKDLEYIDCRLSKLECRITMVDVGNVGGIFNFYVSGCDKGNDFYMKVFEEWDGTLNNEKESFVGWNYGNVSYKSLTHTYNMNDLSRRKAVSRLVEALLSEIIVK